MSFKRCSLSHFSKFVILLILNVVSCINTLTGANTSNHDDDITGSICGTVVTSAGKELTLREGMSLTDVEFETLQRGQISGAEFTPNTENNCAINVCGFTSWGEQMHGDFIGTSGDYGGCELITKATKASPPIYNGKFNTSSLSCGCLKRKDDCLYKSCKKRASNVTWKDNDCAVLFQERDCSSCFLAPVTMKQNSTISTSSSVQFLGAVVRKDCYMEQQVEAFKRMWRHRTLQQPILYNTSRYIQSAFQRDPEKFSCFCEGDVREKISSGSSESLSRGENLFAPNNWIITSVALNHHFILRIFRKNNQLE